MSVTREQVAYIAELAKLRFTESEMEVMTTEMNNILHYVEKLNELDTDGIEPLSSIHEAVNVLRDDIEEEPLTNAEILHNAPDSLERFFKVPKVIG